VSGGVPPGAATATPRQNLSINALRALAALAVMAQHGRNLLFEDYRQAAHTPLTAAFYLVTGLGGAAVMVFFVLSG